MNSNNIMLGETMSRVDAAAAEYGRSTFSTESTNYIEIMTQNETWLREKMTQGIEYILIGLNANRVGGRSPFYEMEIRVCKET